MSRAARSRLRRAARCATAAAGLLLALSPLAGAGAAAEAHSGGRDIADVTRLHEDRPFYRERPEAEEVFEGWLRAAVVVTGPNTRDLPIHLELDNESLPVYAVGEAAERLSPFLDRRVRITGKRVDLRGEGGGVELWPASVARVGD